LFKGGLTAEDDHGRAITGSEWPIIDDLSLKEDAEGSRGVHTIPVEGVDKNVSTVRS